MWAQGLKPEAHRLFWGGAVPFLPADKGGQPPQAKRTRRGGRSELSERARLPPWGRELLAWLQGVPQATTRVGRQEIIYTLRALVRILEGTVAANPLPSGAAPAETVTEPARGPDPADIA